MPAKRPGGASGFLWLPGRTLGALAHHKPDRVELCHGTVEDEEKPKLLAARYRIRHGFQVVAIHRETQGFKQVELATDNVPFRNGEAITD